MCPLGQSSARAKDNRSEILLEGNKGHDRKSLLRYIPKKLHQYVTVLYKMNTGVYGLQLDIDGKEIPATVDGVSNLRWAANYIFEHREYDF